MDEHVREGETRFEYDFFVSRTAADQAWAEWIAWQLEEIELESGRRCRVLLQDWDFVAGSNWVNLMEDGTRKACRVVPIISENYLERSSFGKAEWLAFWRHDPESRNHRVMPVRVADCSIEGLLGSIVYIDLVGLNEGEAITRLRQSIGGSISGRAKPKLAPQWPGDPGLEVKSKGEPRDSPSYPGPERSSRVRAARQALESSVGPRWMNADGVQTYWPHGLLPTENFVGRQKEFDRLSRWSAEDDVRVIGVTSMGGAGKTALINEWLAKGRAFSARAFQGVFGWSFYEERPGEKWEEELLKWLSRAFGIEASASMPNEKKVISCLVGGPPLLLFLDGLEVRQSTPRGTKYGQFLDGSLREILVTLCQISSACLVVLTSRFPFADLEIFSGAAARMLDVQRLSSVEAAELLGSAGGGWLADRERLRLVESVDGHALGISVLAAALQGKPSRTEVATLEGELRNLGSVSRRVARLLDFYSNNLSEADRKLVAIVSLFQRPTHVDVIRSLGATLRRVEPAVEWSRSEIRDAVRQRLFGLLTWHGNNTISAHPFIRDHFRPQILSPDVARAVSDTSLADLPSGAVTTYAEVERVVEIIELLLDAGQWEEADTLYAVRTVDGWLFLRLPAVRLGLRASISFIESRHLKVAPAERFNFYLNEAGLFASKAGDMETAERFLQRSAESYDKRRSTRHHCIALRNLTRLMISTGRTKEAEKFAQRALSLARHMNEANDYINSAVLMATAMDLLGGTRGAESLYFEANIAEGRIATEGGGGNFLYSGNGILWADFLIRTNRHSAAKRLTERNRRICASQGWRADVARCDSILGRCDLATKGLESAAKRLTSAVSTFRAGEMLNELVEVLPEMAEYSRLVGNLEGAQRLCTEAITISGPRNLIRAHIASLAARSRVRVDAYLAQGIPEYRDTAEDDVEQALRLSTRRHRLPWSELCALEAQSYFATNILNQDPEVANSIVVELRTELIPGDLSIHPLQANRVRSK